LTAGGVSQGQETGEKHADRDGMLHGN
jgi:hypothetical protein